MDAEATWQTGADADGATVEGHETSHNFILNSYHLDVEFVDQTGGSTKGRSSSTRCSRRWTRRLACT